MVLIAQELGSDVCMRDVVLRVVRQLPHVPSRRRVEDQLLTEEAADPPRRRFDTSANRGHLGIVGGRLLGRGAHASMMATEQWKGEWNMQIRRYLRRRAYSE
jgi:hypothetical protein